MNTKSKKLVKAAGIAGATAVVASLSALATTNFLCKVALDREQPTHFQKAQNAISGSDADPDFLEKKQMGSHPDLWKPFKSPPGMGYSWLAIGLPRRIRNGSSLPCMAGVPLGPMTLP